MKKYKATYPSGKVLELEGVALLVLPMCGVSQPIIQHREDTPQNKSPMTALDPRAVIVESGSIVFDGRAQRFPKRAVEH
jgi:hypothetical protein